MVTPEEPRTGATDEERPPEPGDVARADQNYAGVSKMLDYYVAEANVWLDKTGDPGNAYAVLVSLMLDGRPGADMTREEVLLSGVVAAAAVRLAGRSRRRSGSRSWGHWVNPVLYMSRATARPIWPPLFGAEPDLNSDLSYGATGIPVLFDDRMGLGESRLEEDPGTDQDPRACKRIDADEEREECDEDV